VKIKIKKFLVHRVFRIAESESEAKVLNFENSRWIYLR